MKHVCCIFIILLCHKLGAASYTFDFNANCYKAYRQLMALQNDEANETLKAELIKHPNNLIPIYLADYADCLVLLFNGDEQKYQELKRQQEERLSLLEQGDEDSPWHRFCRANIHLHAAIVHLRFGDHFKAATKFRKSFLLLKENENHFPNFQENKVLFGLEQSIAGAIPEQYKWIGSLLGIKGDIKNGVTKLVHYLNTYKDAPGAMQEEAMIYYAYLKFYLQSHPETAWRYINGSQFDEHNNLMRSFIKANLALNYRKAESAFSILKKAEQIRGYEQYPLFKYELAEAMLAKLDPKCATLYQQFLKEYKGQHFVKDALLKTAWIAYLQNNIKEAQTIVEKIKTKGNVAADADQQAQSFAEKPIWPLKSLLESKLLFDGGNYQKAQTILQQIDKKQLGQIHNILEYNFRYGRLFEELNNHEKAILFYNATIQLGRNRKEYYAARAALQKGLIYEKQGHKKLAITSFTDCLSMRKHAFQSSIDQLAKAGLNRLEE
jgi:tetratricopeptide (TPR) repeat protein